VREFPHRFFFAISRLELTEMTREFKGPLLKAASCMGCPETCGDFCSPASASRVAQIPPHDTNRDVTDLFRSISSRDLASNIAGYASIVDKIDSANSTEIPAENFRRIIWILLRVGGKVVNASCQQLGDSCGFVMRYLRIARTFRICCIVSAVNALRRIKALYRRSGK